MELSLAGINNRSEWEKACIELPGFNVEKMLLKTATQPEWVHFGAGNIFRAFTAALQQELLNSGRAETGIVAVETFDYEIIDRIYKPYDNLSLLTLMKLDGTLDKKVIASVAESLKGDASKSEDWDRLKLIFSCRSLRMASFTITEKGYLLTDMNDNFIPVVKKDMENGPRQPIHVMSIVTSLAYHRFLSGQYPIAFVSMDNCSRNGEKLSSAMYTIAQKWQENGFVEPEFLDYLKNESLVSYPWSMIDKITPRPSQKVATMLAMHGFKDSEIICTQKNTYIAPFVNAEIPQYLVIEDKFPNGRMPLEAAGVLFTDRETVENVERMKVTTCLNPLHTALAVFGCLLGYTLIADEMKDDVLKRLVEKIGYTEGMPVVVHPGILNPKDFIREVIELRLPNPYIPDMPQRIATDTSQKVSIRFGETIKSYVSKPELDVTSLQYIPLAIAGWCRYLLALDDEGNTMTLSPDPMLSELTTYLEGIELGKPGSANGKLKPILSSEKLFSIDLYKAGLGEKIEGYFGEMLTGKNAVRNTLNKYLQ